MLTVHQKFQDGWFTVLEAGVKGILDILRPLYPNAHGAHGLRNRHKALRRGNIHADKSVVIKIHLIFGLRAPPHVPEDAGNNRQVVLHGSTDFMQAHTPGTIADNGDDRRIGTGDLGAQGCGIGKPGVAEGQCGDMASGLVELEVAVGSRSNIADVGRDNGIVR